MALLFSKQMVLLSTNARPILIHPKGELVLRIVRELSEKAKIEMPEVYLIPGRDINAFALHLIGKPVVAITEGALEYLNEEELKAVLAHEITHIKNKDSLYMTVVSVLAGFISYLLNFLQFYVIFGSYDEDRNSPLLFLLSLVLSILIPIVVLIIQLAISRSREYLADIGACLLTNNPDALVSALLKIRDINARNLPKVEALEPLYFVDVGELFSTHPPIERRIKTIIEAFNLKYY
jgi:heat shock protein HtpX